MGNPIKLENRNLSALMNSAGFGVVTTGGEGTVKKSALFAGLAQIRSFFSGDSQKENIKARTEFANTLIKEFGVEPDSFDDRALKNLYTGDNKTKPLSIRDAQRIITGLGERTEAMKDYMKVVQEYNSEEISRLALNTLGDKKLFSEDIGIGSKSTLKNLLVKIGDKSGTDPLPEMVKAVESWLKVSGQEPTPSLVKATLKELDMLPEAKTGTAQERSPAEARKLTLESVTEYWNGMAATGLSDIVLDEITNVAISEAKSFGHDTSSESIKSVLTEAGVFKDYKG